jgi:branched-subunit amino acid aminotransferase/4-amino-4-deoxychorismate lyase
MVFQNCYCVKYENRYAEWCILCKTDDLKQNFANWTSGNKEIDNYIQEMQLKIEIYDDIMVEWIPYNQFKNITETSKSNSFTVYLATWINGPLQIKERIPNKEVTLKCINNSQNNISEFLNEVYNF